MLDFTLKRAGQRRPDSFGGMRRGVRRPLYGHLNTASGGKRGGPLKKNIGSNSRPDH
jgi:hypothetical protein